MMVEIDRLYMVTYAYSHNMGNVGFVHVDSGDYYYVSYNDFQVALNNPNNYFINWDKSGYTQGSLITWQEKVSSCRTAVDRSAVFICYKVKAYPTMLGKKDYFYCIGEDGIAKGFLTELDLIELNRQNRLVNGYVDKNGVIRLNADSILTYTPEEFDIYMQKKELVKKSLFGRNKNISKYDLVESHLNEKQVEYLKDKRASGRYKGLI